MPCSTMQDAIPPTLNLVLRGHPLFSPVTLRKRRVLWRGLATARLGDDGGPLGPCASDALGPSARMKFHQWVVR